MNAEILHMRVFYDTNDLVKAGSSYYQIVCRRADAGFEVGIYHGELKELGSVASPNDPKKLTFPSDVAEYYLLKTQTQAESDFDKYCEEIQSEGFQPYVPQIHGT